MFGLGGRNEQKSNRRWKVSMSNHPCWHSCWPECITISTHPCWRSRKSIKINADQFKSIDIHQKSHIPVGVHADRTASHMKVKENQSKSMQINSSPPTSIKNQCKAHVHVYTGSSPGMMQAHPHRSMYASMPTHVVGTWRLGGRPKKWLNPSSTQHVRKAPRWLLHWRLHHGCSRSHW